MICRNYLEYLNDRLLPRKCAQYGVVEGEARKAFAKIEPIFINAEKANRCMMLELYRQFKEYQQWHFPNVRAWAKIVNKILNGVQLDRHEVDTLFMVSYMAIAEGAHKFVVDWLCCTLATADATSEFGKSVKSWKYVYGKELAVKNAYLEANNLDRIARALDLGARNAAAHTSFKVEQNGIITIWETASSGNPRAESKINIGTKYEKLRTIPAAWYQAIEHCYDVHFGPYKTFPDSVFATEESIAAMELEVARLAEIQKEWWPDAISTAEN